MAGSPGDGARAGVDGAVDIAGDAGEDGAVDIGGVAGDRDRCRGGRPRLGGVEGMAWIPTKYRRHKTTLLFLRISIFRDNRTFRAEIAV